MDEELIIKDERKIICNRCRKFKPVSDIKYMPKGDSSKIALCSDCRQKSTVTERSPAKKQADSFKQNYYCTRCRYKFRFDPYGVTNLKCPNCGESDKVREEKAGE